MKQFIFSLIIALGCIVGADAQALYGGRMDSLSASSAVDTVKFYPGGTTYGLATMANTYSSSVLKFGATPYNLVIDIASDSISGATGGTVYVQCYNGTGTPREKDWVTVGSGTMTTWANTGGAVATATGGVMTLNKNVSGYSLLRQYGQYNNTSCAFRQWRVIALCPSSTQVTTVDIDWRVTPICQ